MTQETFKALFLEQDGESVRPTFRDLTVDDLPQGDVLVSIAYSTLNYKDALAITNKGKIIRNFPFIPGIDFAGTVEQSQSPDFKPGDQVILTGWGVGERHWGGHAQKARVKADWLVPLPDGLSLQDAMGIRTMAYSSSVASCGNAGSNALSTTVLPFILRAVNLLGIDSVSCPQPRRRQAWSRLQRDLPKAKLRRMIQVVPLEQVPALSDKM